MISQDAEQKQAHGKSCSKSGVPASNPGVAGVKVDRGAAGIMAVPDPVVMMAAGMGMGGLFMVHVITPGRFRTIKEM